MKNKHLIFLFIGTLLVGWSLKRCQFGQKGPFEGSLFDMDTSLISQFRYWPSGDERLEIAFFKSPKGWFALQNGRTISLDPIFLNELMTAFSSTKILKMAGSNRADWPSFGISDSLATRLFIEKKEAGERSFFIGKLVENGLQKEAEKPTTFARLPTGEEVFEIETNLAELLSKPFNSLRNSTLCQFETDGVVALAFNYPNQPPVILDRVEGSWQTPGGSAEIPETRLAGLFRVLQKVRRGLSFADDFGEMEKSRAYTTRLLVSTREAEGSFSLIGYRRAERAGFVVNSSANPSTFFELPDSLARLLFANPLEDIRGEKGENER